MGESHNVFDLTGKSPSSPAPAAGWASTSAGRWRGPAPTWSSPAARPTTAPSSSRDRGPRPPGRPARARRARPGQHRALAEAAIEADGKIDILVNNAGCNVRKPPGRRHLGRLEPGPRHQPARDLLRRPGRRQRDDPPRYGRIINIGSVTCVAGLRRARALRRKPRRRQAAHHEPRRRLGRPRHHRQLPGPGMVQDRAERRPVRERGMGRVPLRPHPAQAARVSPTTSTARSSSWPPTPASTSPARPCWWTAASPPEPPGPCRRGRTEPHAGSEPGVRPIRRRDWPRHGHRPAGWGSSLRTP